MLTIRKMTGTDRDKVLGMMEALHTSSAMLHPTPVQVRRRTFEAAAGGSTLLDGYVLEVDGDGAGYAYVSRSYSGDVGGEALWVEELYVASTHRGQGLGSRFLTWLVENHPAVRRFRLEVTRENEGAEALYRRLGFEPLSYRQLVLDRSEEAEQ